MKTVEEQSQKAECRRAIPVWRKASYGLATAVLLLLLLEGALAVIGVRPYLDTRDPYVGFASYVPLFVDDTDDNGRAVLRTAQNKLEYFNAQQFSKDKPAGTVRIFCMGGSTTFGRPYDDTTSFAGWLREMLPVSVPDKKWQVINAGGISYASYRVATVMEELVNYQPDLFIVYTGHNEFLEERTYGELRDVSPSRKWFTTAASRSRTLALMHQFLGPDRKIDRAQMLLSGEVNAVLDHTVGPTSYERDDALRKQILEHYEWNLHKMVDLARSVGAKVVFIKPASNLKDSSPFKSHVKFLGINTLFTKEKHGIEITSIKRRA